MPDISDGKLVNVITCKNYEKNGIFLIILLLPLHFEVEVIGSLK